MLGGPAGLPRDMVERLGSELRQILADPQNPKTPTPSHVCDINVIYNKGILSITIIIMEDSSDKENSTFEQSVVILVL